MKPLRWMLLSSLGIVALILVGLLTLITLINPNDYKDQLSTLVYEKTGMVLSLKGDIGWQFFPSIGFAIEDASLSLQADTPTLASIEKAALSVNVLPLFKNQVQVNELFITGLNVDLIVTEQGHTNWTKPTVDSTISPTETPSEDNQHSRSQALPDISVPLVSISNSQLRYQDKSTDTTVKVQIQSVIARNITRSKFFTITAEFILSHHEYTLKNSVEGRIKVDDQNEVYSIDELDITTTLDGIASQSIPLGLKGNLLIDMSQSKMHANLYPRIAAFNSTIEASVEAFDSQPQISATLDTENFDIKTFLTSFGITPPKTTNEEALTNLKLNTKITATKNIVSIEPLTMVLDNSTFTGNFKVQNFDDPQINFSLGLNHLNVDDYLPPQSDEGIPNDESISKPNSTNNDEDLFPVEALKKITLHGTVNIDQLEAKKAKFEAIHLDIKANNGLIQLNNFTAKGFDGHISGSTELDVSNKLPKVHTTLLVDKIEVESVLKIFMEQPLLSGKTSVDLNITGHGKSTSALLRKNIGNLTFQLDDGLLQGINLNQLISNGLQTHFSSLASLAPDIQQLLPNHSTKNTALQNVVSNMNIENGVLAIPKFKAENTEGNIHMTGKIDLIEHSFSSRFNISFQKLQDNKYLGNILWPMECKGLFSTPLNSWCSFDSAQVKRIINKAAKNATKVKLAETLNEKLKISEKLNDRSDETVEEQLKNRAKDKLNEKLNNILGF